MLRIRRYRVFLVFAVFVIGVLYHFTSVRDWQDATASSVESLKHFSGQGQSPAPAAPDTKGDTKGDTEGHDPMIVKIEPTTSTKTPDSTSLAPKTDKPQQGLTSAIVPAITAAGAKQGTASPRVTTTPGIEGVEKLTDDPGYQDGKYGLGGQGAKEVPLPLTNKPPLHWSRMPDHFPVPSDKFIPLPTGAPVAIPKIQHAFTKESAEQKTDREDKLKAIKEAFRHSYQGYKDHAWLSDELMPVTGGKKNLFGSWGATLVDALDSLWIMGMNEEFTAAVTAVRDIDFTTTPRKDIPLFETTIRYLGGLIAAYDISDGQYKVLLEKAVELADVLMGAFDTPNRMPITYYHWAPTFAKNPHRAGTRTVMAELGSLSVEFTRLAQLTKEPRYYDAIARITNELELWQNNTGIPGLWPKIIDTSGCRKPTTPDVSTAHSASHGPKNEEASRSTPDTPSDSVNPASNATLPQAEGKLPKSMLQDLDGTTEDTESRTAQKDRSSSDKPATEKTPKSKRQLSDEVPKEEPNSPATESDESQPIISTNNAPEKVDCEAQGLALPPSTYIGRYTLGAMADSTYEYLPKQFMLLGGRVSQYQTMYERAIDAANKYLLFRPMIKDEKRSLLVVGSADVEEGASLDEPDALTLKPEQTHLTCFAGGMWGIGAKVFGRDADLDIAKKLTDGCVWAYEATNSGVMPESMRMIPCASKEHCEWNQTLWQEILDPYREQREKGQWEAESIRAIAEETEKAGKAGNVGQVDEVDKVEKDKEARMETKSATVGDHGTETSPISNLPTSGPVSKRQAGKVENDAEVARSPEKGEEKPLVENPEPTHFPTHEEYVENRIKMERLPLGVPSIKSRAYILRPEAIESVFIMYRTTGDEEWRKKGWRMFTSIQKAALAEYGYSAVHDVTKTSSKENLDDSMESFWMAETLKYFYLLFSDPSLVSLDDYVLNTEAHPFKRPKK